MQVSKPDKKQKLQEKKPRNSELSDTPYVRDFFDRIVPSTVRFFTDHYLFGNTYRCAWAVREYSPTTRDQAILRKLGDKDGVTLRIYTRLVTHLEQGKILANATRKNKLVSGSTNDVQESVEAQGNLQDVVELMEYLRHNKEPLLHCVVYVELVALSMKELNDLQAEIETELKRNRITIDKLYLRQKDGFLSVNPLGSNQFGEQFERVLPCSSVANLYPFSYSGKTDSSGFYLGKDKYGTNILVDVNKRDSDKTNANVLILGNSGQGKSYLLKLLLTNLRESGKSIIGLDPEGEYRDLIENLGGSYYDLLRGDLLINPLEPKLWVQGESDGDTAEPGETVPKAFLQNSILSQHIAFLRDFFKTYKDFPDSHIDALEIILIKLYKKFKIGHKTNFSRLDSGKYPILSDLYELLEQEYKEFGTHEQDEKSLYTEKILQELCLGLHSMCIGSDSKFFNGHTNIPNGKVIMYGVKEIMDIKGSLKDTLLLNILSYMSHCLLSKGNTVASIDEYYLFLTNKVAIEYTRNFAKRARKKDSLIIIASQHVEDFLPQAICEYTKPLLSIPTHQFLFHCGTIEERPFKSMLQLDDSEYELIRYPDRGACLYKCGNERYNLKVIAPRYKRKMFGNAGGA